MRRLLPTLAAFALVIVGVGGGLLLLSSRDQGGLETTSPAAPPANGPAGLAAGNVVVEYSNPADGDAIDALAAELGAIDAPATRATGQALVSKRDAGRTGIRATSGGAMLELADATDPRLAAFVREHLGRTDQR